MKCSEPIRASSKVLDRQERRDVSRLYRAFRELRARPLARLRHVGPGSISARDTAREQERTQPLLRDVYTRHEEDSEEEVPEGYRVLWLRVRNGPQTGGALSSRSPCIATSSRTANTLPSDWITWSNLYGASSLLLLPQFTGVRGRGILRSRSNRNSRKFTLSIMHIPGLIQQAALCKVSKVHRPAYIRH